MQDQPIQRAVLSLALEAHPESLTMSDLAREIGRGDAIERAVQELVGVGLLDCQGVSIQPSAAALHFERLELP